MSYTLEEIRTIIQSGQVQPDFSKSVWSGVLNKSDGSNPSYNIYIGWDLVKAQQIDDLWGKFNFDLTEFIASQNYTTEDLDKINSYIDFGDEHWNWFNKSCFYKSDEYKWFYLYSENKPQAVCLIYHPKQSLFTDGNIFYIEYIAVAPWNRRNPKNSKDFSRLGHTLIQCIVNYATQYLDLTLGFSLHSLPGARDFYIDIGMQIFPENAKEGMDFFEMPSKNAEKYLGVS